ncbi:CD36 antigen [Nannochloropsis gaditana]|uniref:CD36 antigen n=1 Tax=Nannochloropsis gaditana TaxID=72520 RepID=W7TMV3_9STRA|nr:CD36 antigen [Nannochloropsis gaditana]
MCAYSSLLQPFLAPRSLTWRQWAVGDVLQTFSGAALPESVLPETPPELSFYMAAVGKPVWTPVGIVVGENEVPPPISPARWSLKQTKCMRDLILRETDADFFAETVLGLPPSPTQTSRKTFLDVESAMARSPEASKAALEQCLVSQGAWSVMLGYFDYLGRTFAGPHLREHVVEANGGLIVTRSVQSWLEGRPEPILSSSLPPNDPRIWFGIMTEDEKMEAPGKCVQVSDIENMYSACSPVTAPTDPTTLLYYKKVANTYHTGKKHPDRLGAMAKYKGDDVAWGIWPRGKIPILGGAEAGQGSVVQYGYSEGEQFPPLNRILRATEAYVGPGLVAGLEKTFNSLAATGNATTTTALAAMTEETVESPTDMLVFMSNFVLPVRFQYRGPRAPIQGLTGLHRFGLSPLNFSPRRRDAALYSMDGPRAREGLLNMTDIKGAPFFLSPPHYLGCPKLQSLECLSAVATIPQGESEAAVGSHLDIEPYTGRTLSASVSLQVSSSTMGAARVYDVFHAETYTAEVVPLLWMTHQAEVGPEDAALFQELVNAPLDFVTKVQRLTLLVGILTAGVGLFLALLGFFCLCRKSGRGSKTESDARRARGHFI